MYSGRLAYLVAFLSSAFLTPFSTSFGADKSLAPQQEAPTWLSPYIIDTGDLDSQLLWLKPRYASREKEREHWAQALKWAQYRQRLLGDLIIRDLQARGAPTSAVPNGCYGDRICSAIIDGEALASNFSSWRDFELAVSQASPRAAGFLAAVTTVEKLVTPGSNSSLQAELDARHLIDQTLRLGVTGSDMPSRLGLAPDAQRVFRFLVWLEVRRTDSENTRFLRALLDRSDWPKLSEISERGQQHLHLLVQHADADPELQYRALKSVEALVSRGEAVPKFYGLLYDRVMLLLSGRQRFGTQLWCKDGKMELRALEDPERIETYRREFGMRPLADYVAKFPKTCES